MAPVLETGHYAMVKDLAAGERINPSDASQLLRLTLQPADIVETILGGRQPEGMTLPGLMEGVPVAWSEQHRCPGESVPSCDGLAPTCRGAIGSEDAR
jgi:hypothetical protein